MNILLYIILVIFLLFCIQYSLHKEYFDTLYTLDNRATSLVCAYYSFRHDPKLDLKKNSIFKYYPLEWKKKTEAVGLPYVYEYLFFEMHYYVLFQSRRNVDITYRDLLEYIKPFVNEIYTKDERYFNNVGVIKQSICNLDEIIEPVEPIDLPEVELQIIYNMNRPRHNKLEILPNDRAGNNSREMRP